MAVSKLTSSIKRKRDASLEITPERSGSLGGRGSSKLGQSGASDSAGGRLLEKLKRQSSINNHIGKDICLDDVKKTTE